MNPVRIHDNGNKIRDLIPILIMGLACLSIFGLIIRFLPDKPQGTFEPQNTKANQQDAELVTKTILHLARAYLTLAQISGFEDHVNNIPPDTDENAGQYRALNSHIVMEALPNLTIPWDERQELMVEIEQTYGYILSLKRLESYEAIKGAQEHLQKLLAESRKHFPQPKK